MFKSIQSLREVRQIIHNYEIIQSILQPHLLWSTSLIKLLSSLSNKEDDYQSQLKHFKLFLSAIFDFRFQLFSVCSSTATVESIGRRQIPFYLSFWCFNKVFLSGITVDFSWWNESDFSCTVIKALSIYQMECLQGWLGNHSSDSPGNFLSILWYIPNVQNSLMPKFGTKNHPIVLCFWCLTIIWVIYI